MPRLVLPIRFIRPFTLMFSVSLHSKNIWPKVPCLSRASARQWHTLWTLSSFSSQHSQQSCLCVSPSLNMWALRVVRPVDSSRESSKLLTSHCLKLFFSTCQRFTHKDLGLVTTCISLPPIQVLLSQMTPANFFAHNQRDANSLVRRHSISPFLGKFTSFISRYSVIAGYPC